jgi:hypothetical protein
MMISVLGVKGMMKPTYHFQTNPSKALAVSDSFLDIGQGRLDGEGITYHAAAGMD